MSDLARVRRILVPVDFSPADPAEPGPGRAVQVEQQWLQFAPASLRAVELAAGLARQLGAELRMVHATPALDTNTMYTGPAGVTLPPQMIQELHERARQTSIAALQLLCADLCKDLAVTLAARPGVPLQVILEEAETFGAQLVVLAASGRTRVARFFMGSTADRVIRQATCPVLVVPAGD
jgi:nucleotide-binding universal stress UspA family protein